MENGLARLTSRDVYENSNARFVLLSIGSGIIAVICPATDEISPRIWAHNDALRDANVLDTFLAERQQRTLSVVERAVVVFSMLQRIDVRLRHTEAGAIGTCGSGTKICRLDPDPVGMQ
jgi:hypothetical protein